MSDMVTVQVLPDIDTVTAQVLDDTVTVQVTPDIDTVTVSFGAAGGVESVNFRIGNVVGLAEQVELDAEVIRATDREGNLQAGIDAIVAGGGAGDMLSTNNLSELSDPATARGNLGLGTAATHPSSDYASAIGLTAEQAARIGADAGLQADIDAIVATVDNIVAGVAGVATVNGEAGWVTLDATDIPFTPAGSIAATTVQTAIEEVRDEASGAYTHTQDAASALWTVAHGLGGFPNVTVTDTLNREVEADVVYLDGNTITVEFAQPTTGLAYLS